MVKDYGIDFCEQCRKWTKYTLQKKNIVKKIGDKEYIFSITIAVCAECGAEMSPLGLIDKNVEEINEQYEKYANSKKITVNMR